PRRATTVFAVPRSTASCCADSTFTTTDTTRGGGHLPGRGSNAPVQGRRAPGSLGQGPKRGGLMSERHPPQVEHPVVTGPREGAIVDPRPRERRRAGIALRTAVVSAVIGAIVVFVLVWIVGVLSSGGFSAWVYLIAALGGAAAGPVLGPFVPLSKDDGTDA